MHIPDGFLSTPVWAALDAGAIVGVSVLSRSAGREVEETRIPLLGVMGAFVFAAQMINFPVGPGTSGHLVGAALLAYTLGPAAASFVMTAILAVQALVFQDGGLLALGANVFNMAFAGVLAAYLPYRLLRGGNTAIFLGASLSVLTSAALAMGELLISGVPIRPSLLMISVSLFVVSALVEGAITLAALRSLRALNPAWVKTPGRFTRVETWAVGSVAIVLAAFGVMLASGMPDGLERLLEDAGVAARAKPIIRAPLADYEAVFLRSEWLKKASAGLAGLALIYTLCLLAGRLLARRGRS